MLPQPLVSVIIPAKNGALTIAKCLQFIAEQTHKNIEVLLIDSGSIDETLSIATQFDFVRILQIPPHTFNHGLTRNFGVSEAKGEFVLFTVQDAYANSNDWIEKMLVHFLQDEEVVGVCGQQIVPHDADKNPHEWFRPVSKPGIRIVQIKDFMLASNLNPKQLKELCGWDDVNAMYRKTVLKECPFRKTDYAEDLQWAKEVVLAGKKIVYDTRAQVCHYHHSTYDYAYKRTLTVYFHTYSIFGYIRSVNYSFRDYLIIVYRNIKYKAPLHWIFFNWRAMRARQKASDDIKAHLNKDIESLRRFHDMICKTPPQGKQNA